MNSRTAWPFLLTVLIAFSTHVAVCFQGTNAFQHRLLLVKSPYSHSSSHYPHNNPHHATSIFRPASVVSQGDLVPVEHHNAKEHKNGASSSSSTDSPKIEKTNLQLGNDSREKFASDLKHVLKVLRPSDDDPEVPALIRKRRLSMTNMWSLDDWVKHSTRTRFIHYARSLPTSRLLRRVAPQFSVFLVWTIFAVFASPRGLIHRAVVPLTPLSLVSTFVGALLTMRSNTGLARLTEGRVSWGIVVFRTRELGQLIATKVYPKDPQLSFLMARHVSLFGWVLKAHLRGKQKDIQDVVRTMLPPVDAEYVLSQRKLPAAILTKLRQIIQQLAERGQLTMAEEMALDKCIADLDHELMTADRICASPIPPLYTSHTSRLLMFYLAALPLALHHSSLHGFVTFMVSAIVGYTMLGLDEISHLLEQPFRFMPLLQLSKVCMLDVGDSMVCPPAPLDQSLSQLSTPIFVDNGSHYEQQIPEYR